jgi:hypothetical protein
MIDFHQNLTLLAQQGKSKTSWKIRYRGDYLRMSSGKESWNTKGYAKAALMHEFDSYFQAHASGFSTISELFNVPYCSRPISCKAAYDARYKTAQEELLKLVEFVELKEKEVK